MGALGAGVSLVDRAAAGVVRVAAEGDPVIDDRGVVSAAGAEGTLPDEFVEAFRTTLGRHRLWERDTTPVPA